MAEDTEAAASVFEDETNAIILDPNNSERRYYIEQYTAVKREIWRPGKHSEYAAVASRTAML